MEFVVPLMLAGIGAIAIPIILHLFNRRTARTVDWGAYRFLQSSLLKRRRRSLLEDTLLLVARCLIIAFAALALARPFIRAQSRIPWPVVLPLVFIAVVAFGCAFSAWPYRKYRWSFLAAGAVCTLLATGAIMLERTLGLGSFGRGAARDVAVIVDSSASMGLSRDGISNHERILKEIADDIRTADRTVAFGIIQGGAIPKRLTPHPITDRRALNATLETLRPATGTMDAPAAIAAAAALLAQGRNPVKQIVIYGDGQASGWSTGDETRWNVTKAILSQLPSPPQILWRTLELPSSLRNVAVEEISADRAIIGTDREATIQVLLRNTGVEAVTPVKVTLEVEGRELENRSIGQIPHGATRTVEFRHVFSKAGAQPLHAKVETNDDIELDDSATRILHVIGTLDVLLVEGRPGDSFEGRSTSFMAAALRPERRPAAADPAAKRSYLVAPKVETAAVAARRTSFRDCAVVVLADVPQLPQDTADRLAEFVSNGGGLLIAPGSNIRPEFYSRWSWRGQPLCPLPLSGFRHERRTRNRPSLDAASFTGQMLRNVREQNDLGRSMIAGWWQMDSSANQSAVEGRLSSGDTFLATRRFGRGIVAVSAFPLDATLSNLPSLGSFVPLVHETVYALANPTTARLNVAPSASPMLVLSPGSQQAAQFRRGLLGHYYPKADFTGSPVERIDQRIEFNWGQDSPMSRLPKDGFSVRWTGSFMPPQNGEYNFTAHADDSATIWVNGKTGDTVQYLSSGIPYDMRIDYIEGQGNASVRLLYAGAGGHNGDVPADALSPDLPGSLIAETIEETTSAFEIGSTSNAIPGRYIQDGNGLALQIRANLEPGVYEAETSPVFASSLAPFAGANGRIPFVIVPGIAESDLSSITPEQMAFLRRYIELHVAVKPDEISTALRGKRFGKEIWRTLAAGALLLLLLELLLSRWIAIQRHTGQEETIEFEKATGAPAPFERQLAYLRDKFSKGKAR